MEVWGLNTLLTLPIRLVVQAGAGYLERVELVAFIAGRLVTVETELVTELAVEADLVDLTHTESEEMVHQG